ncbi:MAG: hypothetical protein V7731_12225 [Amphritea sp.]
MEKTLLLLTLIVSLTACAGGGIDNTATNITTNTNTSTNIDTATNTGTTDTMELELKDLEVANNLGFLTEEEYSVTKEIILKKYGS